MDGGDGDEGGGLLTAEDVFREFTERRTGLVTALTTDAAKLYTLCDPKKESLSLWGLPDGTWAVEASSVGEIPPKIPLPVPGINFARDDKENFQNWPAFIAAHSNSWLLAVTFLSAARNAFDKEERDRLFEMINGLPSLSEVVNEDSRMLTMYNTGKLSPRSERESPEPAPPEEGEGSEGGGEDVLCGVCGSEHIDELWICCDFCNTWYHGKCVGITPARAEAIGTYECPFCKDYRRN